MSNDKPMTLDTLRQWHVKEGDATLKRLNNLAYLLADCCDTDTRTRLFTDIKVATEKLNFHQQAAVLLTPAMVEVKS